MPSGAIWRRSSCRRLQDRPLRGRARCPPHGRRPASRRRLRRHAQEQRLGGDRSRQGPRRRRGEAVRAVDRLSRSRTASASRADGFLYVVEQNRVLQFPAAEFFYEGPDVAVGEVVQAGRADPAGGGELQPHRARLPDRAGQQALHRARPAVQRAAEGQAGSLQARRASAASSAWIRTARTARSIATGIRNSVGIDFNPADKTLWFTDNQVDGMGDDILPASSTASPSRAEFRLPLVRRRHGPHGRVQGRPGPGRRRRPRRSRRRRTRPISA